MGGGNEDNKMSGGAIPTSANTHGSASGTTRSAVADGTITVRSGQAQTQNVADLSRDTDNANGHIDKIFDKDKVANKLEFAQGMQELGQRVAGDVSSYQMQAAENETRERLLKANPQYAGYSNEALNTLIVNDPGYKAVAEKWGTGGSYSMAAAAVTGVLGGLGAGDLGAAAAGGMAPYIANKIKHATSTFVNGQEQTNVLANTMAHAVAGAVLAQLAGNSATAGAAGAAGGELMARAILSSMYPGKQASELTQEEKQVVSALGQLAAQLSAGLASGSVEGGIQGAVAGKNAVENNALGSDEEEVQREHGKLPVKIIPINPMKLNVLDGDGNPLKAGGGGLGKISVNKGQQNKHIPGTNEYKIASEAGLNKSILSVPAESLLPKLGTGQQVGNLPVGSPGSKERINYGQNIGNYIDPQTGVSAPTSNGIVHYGKNGVHIVPARPSKE